MNDLTVLTVTGLEIKLIGKRFTLLMILENFPNTHLRDGLLYIYEIDFCSTICIWEVTKTIKL